MALSDIKAALAAWVKACTGFVTVWGGTNDPQPAPPFCRLRYLSSSKEMTLPDKRTPPASSDGSTMFIHNPDDFTLSAIFYGDGAIDAAKVLESSIHKDTADELLEQDQIQTVTVASLAVADYTVRIDDVGITYPAGVGATKNGIRDGLVSLINNDDSLYQIAKPDPDHTDIFTVLSDAPFLFSVGAHLTNATTQAGYGIAIYASHGVQNLTGTVDSQTVEAASIDLDMATAFLDTDTPGVIETVQASGEVTAGGETIATVTIDTEEGE